MANKTKFGILIRKKITDMPDDKQICRFFADVITFGDDGKPRNPRWDFLNDKDYQFFEDLTATCYISNDGMDTPYGYHVEYFSPYSVELRDAEKMYKTLKKINNKLKKMESEFGTHKSFGEYVSRFAKAVGAKVVVFYENFDPKEANYSRNEYIEYKPGKAIEKIDYHVDMVEKQMIEHKILSGNIGG